MKSVVLWELCEHPTGRHFVPDNAPAAEPLRNDLSSNESWRPRMDTIRINTGLMYARWQITTYGLLAGPDMETK